MGGREGKGGDGTSRVESTVLVGASVGTNTELVRVLEGAEGCPGQRGWGVGTGRVNYGVRREGGHSWP